MELSERKKKILCAVVEEYIESAEPVGSKTVVEKGNFSCSSATVRNELAELTSMGYLEQPHTSAGRVPTAKGYRLYVNDIMMEQKLSLEETSRINASFNARIEELDQLMGSIRQMASEITNYPALTITASAAATIRRFDFIYIDPNTFIIVVLLTNNKVKNKYIHLPFSFEQSMMQRLSAVFNAEFTGITEEQVTPELISICERASNDTMGLCSVIVGFVLEVLTESGTEMHVAGEANLLRLPEFRDPDKAHKLISYISDSKHLGELTDISSDGIKVLIGPENIAEELKDSSVILASYNAGDNMQGLIGVVGPTRMDYSRVAAKLSYIANGLSRLLQDGSASPPGFDKLMIKGDGID